MAKQVDEQDVAPRGEPAAEDGMDRTQVLRSTRSIGPEEATEDPSVVRTSRPVVEEESEDRMAVRSVTAMRSEQLAELRNRHGGFYWGSDFIGFAVATFFTVVFLGIVGAVARGVGYQIGAPLPKVGHAVDATTQTIGIGAAAASLVALFLAYLLGGYTAGRMARFDGWKNGLGVVIWTVVVALLLGATGGVLGTRFNVGSQLHLNINTSTFTTAGLIALGVALIVMLLGALLGGRMGELYHRGIDREAGMMP